MKKIIGTTIALTLVLLTAFGMTGCSFGKGGTPAVTEPPTAANATETPAAPADNTENAPEVTENAPAAAGAEELFAAVKAFASGDEKALEGVYSPEAGAAYLLTEMGAVKSDEGWTAAKETAKAFLEDAASFPFQFPTAASRLMAGTGKASLEELYEESFAKLTELPAGAELVRLLESVPDYAPSNVKNAVFGLFAYDLGTVEEGGAQKTLTMLYESTDAGCTLVGFNAE